MKTNPKLEEQARQLQTKHYIPIDCGSYKIYRPLFFHEALARLNKGKLTGY